MAASVCNLSRWKVCHKPVQVQDYPELQKKMYLSKEETKRKEDSEGGREVRRKRGENEGKEGRKEVSGEEGEEAQEKDEE